jgi:MoxR-like ATPase
MFEIKIGYPTEAEELAIIRRTTGAGLDSVEPVFGAAEIEQVQSLVRSVPVPEHVLRYALRLVRTTRVKEPMDGGISRPKMVTDYVGWGAGPRASEYLVLAAKAKALLDGATHATPEHVRAIARPVLRHRIITNFNAEADQVATDAVIDAMLKEVPIEGASAIEKKQMDTAMR